MSSTDLCRPRCRKTVMVTALGLLVLVGVGLLWAPSASAATCQASQSVPIFPVPSTNLTVGQNGGTTFTVTNTSSLVPPPTPPPLVTAAIQSGSFKLACSDTLCNTPL